MNPHTKKAGDFESPVSTIPPPERVIVRVELYKVMVNMSLS